jgi:DnaJ-class molecular chaperone
MEIHPEDLFRKCTACEGDGIITPPKPAAGPIVDLGKPCDRCGGRGMMLTDTGTTLKAFFQMLQDGKF